MNKSYKMGIIAVGIAVLAIGAGTLTLDRTESTNQNSGMNESKDNGMLTDTLSTLEGDKFDQAFINDMVEHHTGAVAMAKLVETEAKDPRIQQLAVAIIADQTREINDMKSWANKWDYGLKDPRQSAVDEMVSGMSGKSGAQLDIAFLSDMIGHHQSAIDMSRLANSNANHQEIKTLASQITTAQESEIKLMKDIATEAGYTLNITEGHHSAGDSHTDGDSHSGTTVKH